MNLYREFQNKKDTDEPLDSIFSRNRSFSKKLRKIQERSPVENGSELNEEENENDRT